MSVRHAKFLLPVLLAAAQTGSCVETEAPPTALANSSWTVTAIGDRAPLKEHPVTIEFHVPGQIAGSGGCNRYGGRCRFEEDFIRVTRIRATRRYCGDDVMELERRFLQLLEGAVSWEVTGDDTLVLNGPDGEIRARREPEDAAQAGG